MSLLVCKVTVEDVTVIIDGNPSVVKRDHPNAEAIIDCAKKYNSTKDSEERDRLIADINNMLDDKDYRAVLGEHFEIDANGRIYLQGTSEAIPMFMSSKIKEFLDNGLDLAPMINFWKHLLLNPDTHVRGQLFKFLENNGHPITENGYFLAYKAVGVKRKYDKETGEEIIKVEYDEETGERIPEKYSQAMTFKPFHPGSFGMSINIGDPVQMPREECDNDPERTCSAGLHVGSMQYVKDFGYGDSVILEVLVNPRNVVSVPVDYNATKMRCCEYFPMAISNGENEEIFLESDYTAFDKEQMEKDMQKFTSEKVDMIAKIEAELAEKIALSNSIYL
jgi:hypothetical protein